MSQHTYLKGHVITTRRGFCDVERSDGNQDNIVQISVTSQGCTLRLEMIIRSGIWQLELLLGVIALLVLLYAGHISSLSFCFFRLVQA